jgi:hypothetical protein
VAYQDLEQASGRLMVIDPAGGTTGSDPQGNYRSQGSEAAAEKAALRGSLLSIVTIPPTLAPHRQVLPNESTLSKRSSTRCCLGRRQPRPPGDEPPALHQPDPRGSDWLVPYGACAARLLPASRRLSGTVLRNVLP